MSIAGIKSHLANWREWELNPIVVKELRQAVRSWAVTGMLLLFLAVLFLISLGFLVFQTFDTNADSQLGGVMFSAFAVILAIASIFFIPLYMGIRVSSERQENNPDLLYVTTLSPARIIRGKFLSGAYMAVLFFSACMPFMAFTNLLRGVDLPTIFFILFYLFLVVCAANMVAIFLACIPASRPFRVLFGLVGSIGCFWTIIPLASYSYMFLHSGIGATMGGVNFWVGTLSAVAIGAAVTGLFYVLAVALVSPPSANRALPVRLYFTAIWLFCGLISFGWVVKTGRADLIYSWALPAFWLLMIALLAVVGSSDHLSQRVRRTIPQVPLKRAFAFLFYNGAAGGLVWVVLMVLATYLAVKGTTGYFTSRSPNVLLVMSAVAVYIFDYSLTALFIQRKFFAQRPAKLTPLIAIALAAFCSLAPSLVLFFLNKLTWDSVEGFEIGNVFNVISLRDDSRVIDHVYFAFSWLVVIAAINAGWFIRQLKNFTPPPKDAPPVIA